MKIVFFILLAFPVIAVEEHETTQLVCGYVNMEARVGPPVPAVGLSCVSKVSIELAKVELELKKIELEQKKSKKK